MKKLNSKGFGAIEILFIIILVATICGISWYVLKSKNTANQSYTNAGISQTNASNYSSNDTVSPVKYFTINEWSLRAPYNGQYKLTYKIANYASGVSMANFTTTDLAKTSSECKSKGAGTIEKAYNDTILDKAGNTPEKSIAKQDPYATIKIDNWYYVYIPYQSTCGGDLDSQGNIQADVKTITSHLVANP